MIKKIDKLLSFGIGAIRNNMVCSYWGTHPNFGDQLTPLLLKYYGYTPVFSHYEPRLFFVPKAQFVSVGTLLQGTPEDFSGVILGSGMDNVRKRFKKATILGVRGYLTKRNLGITDDIILGDPGILVTYVYPKKLSKKWDLGIIPHLFDKGDEIVSGWEKRFGDRVKVIDVQRKPVVVIEEIKRCRNIVSSSLHGLVVADAFAIPNKRFVIRKNYPKKYDFKFFDYYSALDVEHSYIEVTGKEMIDIFLSVVSDEGHKVMYLKEKLHNAYQNLREYLR